MSNNFAPNRRYERRRFVYYAGTLTDRKSFSEILKGKTFARLDITGLGREINSQLLERLSDKDGLDLDAIATRLSAIAMRYPLRDSELPFWVNVFEAAIGLCKPTRAKSRRVADNNIRAEIVDAFSSVALSLLNQNWDIRHRSLLRIETFIELLRNDCVRLLERSVLEGCLLGAENDPVDYLCQNALQARRISIAVTWWAHNVCTVIDRLINDTEFLSKVFRARIAPSQLRGFCTGLSDPHSRGETVTLLTFSGGLKILYKPRKLDSELLLGRILKFVNERSSHLPLTAARSFPRLGYGWSEYIPFQECATEREVSQYYERIGSLLAVMYFLGVHDMHRDNIIASGAFPIIIDSETLFKPSLEPRAPGERDSSSGVFQSLLDDSVIRTGVLPRWRFESIPPQMDFSALGGDVSESPVSGSLQLEHRFVSSPPSVPRQHGRRIPAKRFLETICNSFRRTYWLLVRHRLQFIASKGPLWELEGVRVRVIVRPTNDYLRFVHFAHLVSRRHHGIVNSFVLLSWLIASLDQRFSRTARRRIFWAECRSLENGNIPMFSVSPHGTSLMLPDGRSLPRVFKESGYDGVVRRLASASQGHCDIQEIVIRHALTA